MIDTYWCTYCGSPQGERIQCCSECHWMTAQEYFDYHGEWPDDGEDHDEETGDPVEDYQAEAIATAQSESAFEANVKEYKRA